MKAAVAFFTAPFLFCACAQAHPRPAPVEAAQSRARPLTLENTEQWTLKSKAGRTFEVSIFTPKVPAPATGFPILYVLDPGTSFTTLLGMVRNHELMFGPVVVVGVGYANDLEIANRVYDLTPVTDPATLPASRPQGWGATGGADMFFAFLQDELKPVIEKNRVIDKQRQALFGHSLGGLFVLHVLFEHPEAFDTYIAGSPSIWWGNKQILKDVPNLKWLSNRVCSDRRLLITVGGLEGIVNPEEVRAGAALNIINMEATSRTANMVGNAASLAAQLASHSGQGLQVEFVVFEDETHNSVIPAYLSRGARFTLSGWFN